MSNSQNGRPGHTQHNQASQQPPTQRHEARRTPVSRSDREDHRGGASQTQMRKGRVGQGSR